MISKLGLFSSNETKEDISTTNLKYILVNFVFLYICCMCFLFWLEGKLGFFFVEQVPFYLAELIEKSGYDDRIEILKASQAKLKVFAST